MSVHREHWCRRDDSDKDDKESEAMSQEENRCTDVKQGVKVLSYDLLETQERQEVDAHLASCSLRVPRMINNEIGFLVRSTNHRVMSGTDQFIRYRAQYRCTGLAPWVHIRAGNRI